MKILGHEYTLIERKELGAFGKASLSDGIMYIDTDMTDTQTISTIIHEALEMMNGQLELGMHHAAICGVETGMYQFLIDNGVDLTPLVREL